MLVVIHIFLYNLKKCGTGPRKDFVECTFRVILFSPSLEGYDGQNVVLRHYLTIFSLSNADKMEWCFKYVVESLQYVIMYSLSHSLCKVRKCTELLKSSLLKCRTRFRSMNKAQINLNYTEITDLFLQERPVYGKRGTVMIRRERVRIKRMVQKESVLVGEREII